MAIIVVDFFVFSKGILKESKKVLEKNQIDDGLEKSKSTHITNDRNGNLLGLDRRLRWRYVAQESIADSFEFTTFGFLSCRRSSVSFTFLADVGIFIDNSIVCSHTTSGTQGRRSSCVQ